MSYAVRKDDLGWRAVNGPDDVGPDETYSIQQPLPLQPTHVELALKAETWARTVRLEVFKILDGLQVSALVNSDLPTAQAIEAAKQALRDITTTVPLDSFTTYEEMQQAFIYAYWQIRATVPQNVQSAFNSLVP